MIRLAWRLVPLLAVCILLSCDRESPVENASSSGDFSLSPRILAPAGVVLPTVDSVRIEALDAGDPSGPPYYDQTFGWNRHADTIRQIFRETNILVSMEGLKTQPDGSHAVWWHGTATDTFLGTRRFAAQSLPVPVFVGDTLAPAVLSRGPDTIQSTDSTLRMVWHLREDSSFTAVVDGDTVRPVGDSVVWTRSWTSGSSLPVRASFRDNTGNLSLDSLTAIRRERVDLPAISVPSGSYDDLVHVSISDSTPGSGIQYSVDGGRTWQVYDSAFRLGSDVALQAVATKPGLTASAIAQATYSIAAAAPTFSVPSGTVSEDLMTLKLASATPGSGFQYSTDSGGTWLAYSDSLVLGNAVQLLARTTKAGLTTSPVSQANYSIRASVPVFSVPSGTASNDLLTLTLSSATPGGGFQVSLDTGRTWSAYVDSIALGSSIQVLARTVKAGLATSSTSTATYAIAVATPTFSIPSGTSSNDLLAVMLHCTTPGARIQYSTDSSNWQPYADSLVLGSSTNVYARAQKTGVATSAVAKAIYSVQASAPMFTPMGGTYDTTQSVTIASATPGAILHCTTDGSTPTSASPLCTSPLAVDSATTLRALATKAGLTSSPVSVATYAFDTLKVPVFSLAPGKYTGTQMVSITTASSGASIRYTTDGSMPSGSSTAYAGPIALVGPQTIRAVAAEKGWFSSPVATVSYSVSDYAVPWSSAAVFGTVTDVRDGQTYSTATLGSLTWMAQNLNYRGPAGSPDTVGVCYANSLDSCAKYGRLYTWTEAMAGDSSGASVPSGVPGVCPSGWHLPSDAEWTALQDFADSTNTLDGRMLKSASGWLPNGTASGDGTDDFGFRGLPGGYSNGGFSTAGSIGCWWSATSDGAGGAWYRGLYNSFDDMDRSNYDISDGFSLRCVRDP